jgi:two-component system chemotaxis response regulator CheY
MIRVLVVDDSPFIHKAIARALSDGLHEICGIGKNGREGIDLYFDLSPDVVTMDITMPVMDGLNAAKAILTRDPQAKIIMLSAMGDEELIAGAKEMGVGLFLQKPFKSPELQAAIHSICGEG